MPEKKPFKLNLGAITGKEVEEKSELKDDKINNEENIVSKEEAIEKNDSENTKKIDLSNMLGKKEEKDLKKQKEEEKEETKKRKEEKDKESSEKKEYIKEEDVFVNYKSDFNSEKTTILEKVKKFKEYIKPKTRVGFILTVISITIIGIAMLFLIAPKVHNIENYKNNMIIAKESIVCKVDAKRCFQYEKEREEEKRKIEEKKIVITEEVFIKGSFSRNYKLKKHGGKETIIYKEKEYESIEEFNKLIEKEIKNEKINKLKNHITNKDK